MFSHLAQSMRQPWLEAASLTEPNRVNAFREILAANYLERTAKFNKSGDYRNADFVCCNALLLLNLGDSATPAGAKRTAELVEIADTIAARSVKATPRA